ncbi:hypothetical protein B0H17DRAFT_1140642 [Mycena rosella]|uniref:Uncharacterized protein n=1 Tax=Mycena rosella TaxID=1033263 RepID=A0AAD7D1T8_MYCRO|nr:hypothetical protein B0H17DRAFT_1140642 [Mycena rosella]
MVSPSTSTLSSRNAQAQFQSNLPWNPTYLTPFTRRIMQEPEKEKENKASTSSGVQSSDNLGGACGCFLNYLSFPAQPQPFSAPSDAVTKTITDSKPEKDKRGRARLFCHGYVLSRHGRRNAHPQYITHASPLVNHSVHIPPSLGWDGIAFPSTATTPFSPPFPRRSYIRAELARMLADMPENPKCRQSVIERAPKVKQESRDAHKATSESKSASRSRVQRRGAGRERQQRQWSTPPLVLASRRCPAAIDRLIIASFTIVTAT